MWFRMIRRIGFSIVSGIIITLLVYTVMLLGMWVISGNFIDNAYDLIKSERMQRFFIVILAIGFLLGLTSYGVDEE